MKVRISQSLIWTGIICISLAIASTNPADGLGFFGGAVLTYGIIAAIVRAMK